MTTGRWDWQAQSFVGADQRPLGARKRVSCEEVAIDHRAKEIAAWGLSGDATSFKAQPRLAFA